MTRYTSEANSPEKVTFYPNKKPDHLHPPTIFQRSKSGYLLTHPGWGDNFNNNLLQGLHPGKLTWQWKMEPLKMYFLLNMGIFHCYVSLICSYNPSCHSLVTNFHEPPSVTAFCD